MKDLYQNYKIKDTIDFKHTRSHYYTNFNSVNPNKVISKGVNNKELLLEEHNRDEKFLIEKNYKLEKKSIEVDQKNKIKDKKKGLFVRGVSKHRNFIGDDDEFPAEFGRYTLILALNCPWCSRCYLARNILGLQDSIKVDIAFYRRNEKGWRFLPNDMNEFKDFEINDENVMKNLNKIISKKDSTFGFDNIRDLYDSFNSKESSLPLLIDNKQKKIVSNESADIVKMLNKYSKQLQNKNSNKNKKNSINLYPKHLEGEIEILNTFIYNNINNGAYKAGFTSNQESYEKNFDNYFNALEHLNKILKYKRFLTGNDFTEADLRLLPTIVRHDSIYYSRMKLSKNMIIDYPYLNRWLNDCHNNINGVKESTILSHSIFGYFGRTGSNIIPYNVDKSLDKNNFWY